MFDKTVLSYITNVAKSQDIEPTALAAVCWVESAGTAYWLIDGKEKPAIRFEGHYFDQRLKGAKQKEAREQGLASPVAGAIPNPKSYAGRYTMLERAMKIDRDAALESISIGIGQVMGAHWKKLGYDTVQAMWQDAQSVEGQVRVMVGYIKMAGLKSALNSHDWAKFAKGYNGPNFKKYKYDSQMADAYKRLLAAGPSSTQIAADDAKKEQMKWVQEKLNLLGYGPLDTDGVKGAKTDSAVRQFQLKYGLVADGIPGTLTISQINAALAKQTEQKQKNSLPAVTTGLVGSGVAVTTVVDALTSAQDAADRVNGLLGSIGITGIVAGLLVAGVAGWVVYTMVKKMRYSEPDQGSS